MQSAQPESADRCLDSNEEIRKELTMKSDGPIRVFSGATAIVTGGASGIGRALAEELAKPAARWYWRIVRSWRRKVASGIRTLAGGKATAANLDVTDFPALQQLVNDTVERTGRLDYMFNHAGITMAAVCVTTVFQNGIR